MLAPQNGPLAGGASPTLGSFPSLPRNPAAGPPGPGASPALSVGAGRGHQEAARAQVKMMIEGMRLLLSAFDVYSDEYSALSEAIRSLRNVFGKEKKEDVNQAAVLQLLNQAREARPFAAVPPSGLRSGAIPPPNPVKGGI